jgi:hypothetical protein
MTRRTAITRTFLTLVCLVGLTLSALAQTASSFSSVTVTNAVAVSVTVSSPAVTSALLTVETADIRVRFDGTAPTTAIGHLVAAGSSLTISGRANLTQLKMIATSTTATVRVTQFRP